MVKANATSLDGNLLISYEKVQLIDSKGKAVRADSLKKETNYVFNYPYKSTPVILLNLEQPTPNRVELSTDTGEKYIWKGGVGKEKSVVAYSAICSHQLAHPTPDATFLQYVDKNTKTAASEKSGVIVCSSHLSAFDASRGCKNIIGPADNPLASVILEEDKDGNLWAVGVLGKDMFHDYFKEFKHELSKYYGGKRKGKKHVFEVAEVTLLEEFSKEMIQY
ncbi:Ubiquinol-cytochrome C reductase iron-sulfur subunit [hydrothermal vent metagenome]|uniref:Ubiquinol-cytochrome C reductase iron-sulfur subunit n=1 Tax=hydrothermal vent metagenome TaxID=652676 RepID=A0A1W1BRE0_9ZZZZ